MQAEEQKKAVENFFNADRGWQGDLYGCGEDHFSLLTKRRRAYVTELLHRVLPRPVGRAADVGCGAGLYLGELHAMGFRTFGMDISEEMVKVSRERWTRGGEEGDIHVIRGDIEHLPYRSGSFSLVIAVGVLDYLLDDRAALAGLHRVLAPGGILLLNVRNQNALTALHYTARTRLKEVLSGRKDVPKGRVAVPTDWIKKKHGWNYKKYYLRRFEKLVGDNGFVRIGGMTFGYDFKVLRKLGLPASAAGRLELWCEKRFSAISIPYLTYSGMAYIGLFRKS